MSVLTIRLPDDQHERLMALAAHRGVSMNKLIEELATRVVPKCASVPAQPAATPRPVWRCSTSSMRRLRARLKS